MKRWEDSINARWNPQGGGRSPFPRVCLLLLLLLRSSSCGWWWRWGEPLLGLGKALQASVVVRLIQESRIPRVQLKEQKWNVMQAGRESPGFCCSYENSSELVSRMDSRNFIQTFVTVSAVEAHSSYFSAIIYTHTIVITVKG